MHGSAPTTQECRRCDRASCGVHWITSVVCPPLFSQHLRVFCFFIFQWVFILIKISTWTWSLCKSLFISFHEWDLPLQCCEPFVGIQCHWPPLPPQHAISHTASPRVYSHRGGRSLPGSSMDISPCNCPLGGGLLPRLALLLTGFFLRFTFTSVLRWVSGVFIKLCFLIFMLTCPMPPGRPTRCVVNISALRSPLTATGFSSAGCLLNLLLMGPLLPIPITIPPHLDYSRDPLSGLRSPASP